MDEIRFVAGPIVGRYQDKIEEERQAVLKIEEEKAAKKRAEIEARKKAEEEAKKAKEGKKQGGGEKEDAEMKDAGVDGVGGGETIVDGGKGEAEAGKEGDVEMD